MTRTVCWRHVEELAQVSDADRVVVLDLTRLDAPPVILTGPAAAIWEAVDGARDEDAVVSRVATVYDVPVDEIRDDVLTFLQHLATCQLLARA